MNLMATRLRLDEVTSAVDVGCGVGHWGRTLTRVLSENVTITGVDREQEWVRRAAEAAAMVGLTHRLAYKTAIAEHLPFPDAKFDLATCQTVLIHLPDPMQALREMWRVVRPGGLILVVEPNNIVNSLMGDSVTSTQSLEEVVARITYAITCERGRIALGEGNLSVGDLVPGMLSQLGVEGVRTWLSDKAGTVLPPYETAEEQAWVASYMLEVERRRFIWDHDEALRFYQAAGRSVGEFELAWESRLASHASRVRELDEGTFHFGGGHVMYLVAGRKPLDDVTNERVG
jgi:SAM-dependent methyltransferase